MKTQCRLKKKHCRKKSAFKNRIMLEYWKSFVKNYRLSRGRRLLMKGNAKKALEYFEKVVLEDATEGSLFMMALALVALNCYKEAEKHLETVYATYDRNELVLLSYAECLTMLRKWDSAEVVFAQLARLQPNYQRYKEYLDMIRDAVKRDRFVISREFYAKAQLDVEEKQYEKALENLKKSHEINPDNATVINNIGSVMLLMGQPASQAIEWFERALALEPDNPRFQENLKHLKRKR